MFWQVKPINFIHSVIYVETEWWLELSPATVRDPGPTPGAGNLKSSEP